MLTSFIAIAFAIDLLAGDPRWMPHPVRLIGRLAGAVGHFLRRLMSRERLAGSILVVLTVGIAYLLTWAVVAALSALSPILGGAASIFFLYTALATKDLFVHSDAVVRALASGDIEGARRCVGRIVGRDTEGLDEKEISRAAVESVAENTVDGIIAPLFYAFIGGPPLAMAYKAVNTLDSMFGYKTEAYINFGWASARLDDLANYLPARLTGPIIAVAAFFVGGKSISSFRIFWRDRKKHPSPNSGHSEAAFAGALGVQIGGLNYYFGAPSYKPAIGDKDKELEAGDIRTAQMIMFATSALALMALASARALFWYYIVHGRPFGN